ncbi:MAG TPA: hypothetical protein DEP18_02560 [Flavobacteriales bacterium]|nr:hypothetical protein [Flavobacteriales bacterium]HRE75363.1 hypothetical protein [Flavobacteriales bacterium]HRE95809.1 hypothetical protein [Flavobacteriales bacterium]HRJ37576.1 hypothetical protein [Flavobacteriales bacterium]
MKTQFIYWFAYYNLDSPSVRYRGKFPLDFIKEEKGIDNYFVVPSYRPKEILLFLRAYLSALFFRKRNSLIVIQRVQSNFIYARLLKLLVLVRKKNTIYDLDDADYLEINPSTLYFFAKNCERVFAGSAQIERHLSAHNSSIVFSTSPTVDLGIVKKNRNSVFTIGWIGGFGGDHKSSLIELVFPAILQMNFPVKFTIVGVRKQEDIDFINAYFSSNQIIEINTPLEIDWKDENEIQSRIVTFDIGIATLTNTELQLSKSGIKAKQYMNNGIPVLSTNLPENNTVVVDGYNGYFCSSRFDFEKRMRQFAEFSDHEYATFSVNARQSITNFNHVNYFRNFEYLHSKN